MTKKSRLKTHRGKKWHARWGNHESEAENADDAVTKVTIKKVRGWKGRQAGKGALERVRIYREDE